MTPAWDREGPLVSVVHEAAANNATRSEIVDVLSKSRFQDIPRRRVEAIVAGAIERRTPEPGKASPSQPTQTDERPRSVPTRFIEYGDIEYLGDREFARLLGLIFERFRGSTAYPLLDAVDVLWHRQYDTVGVQAVASQDSERTLESIEEIATGKTNPPNTRAPSQLAVVTAAAVGDELTAAASDVDVELYGCRQVARWLRIAQLPPSAYGPLLEEGEQSSFDTESVLNQLSPLPSCVGELDPLDIDGSRESVDIERWPLAREGYEKPSQPTPSAEPGLESGSNVTSAPKTGQTAATDSDTARVSPSTKTDGAEFKTQPPKGEYGKLYADPTEDGDFDGIDAWVDGVGQEES